jgi:predicted transcriptional regulator
MTESDIARELGMTRQALGAARRSGRCSQSRDPEVLRVELEAYRRVRDRLDRAKAEERELRVRQLKGELIARGNVLSSFFDAAKLTRERLEQWPATVAAELAAELGLDDPHKVETALAGRVDAPLRGIVERMRREL